MKNLIPCFLKRKASIGWRIRKKEGFFVISSLAIVGMMSGFLSSHKVFGQETSWVEQGRVLIEPFKKRLMGELKTALEKGPKNAIFVCQKRAPQIAMELSSPGRHLGRTSHKLRNPENAPKPWVEPFLKAYLENPGETSPKALRLQGDWVGYVEPIFVGEMCLTCHGERLDPDIESTLKALYPKDRAKGFKLGDFRGLFWAEFRPDGPID